MTDDRQILELYREEGKEEYAYNLIVREYGERLYWHIRELVCSHEDANDLLQDTLIKAWKGLPSFREESRLYTWLYRIATNEALTFLKKKRERSAVPSSMVLHLFFYFLAISAMASATSLMDCISFSISTASLG